MRLIALATAFLALPLLVLAKAKPSEKPLVVHEWGTFTSLQDESGKSIGGVNVDDEPVPAFVHRFGPEKSAGGNLAQAKGYQPGNPSVTMRLETPVMYFYPPDDTPVLLDVQATFNGGLLTEFYPNALTTCDDQETTNAPDTINADTRGGLHWQNVIVKRRPTDEELRMYMAPPPKPPITNAAVWLAPRDVKSTPVYVGFETEQYLFYRGVGHIESPVKVTRSEDGKSITASSSVLRPSSPIWLAEFRAEGACAFRRIEAVNPASCAAILPPPAIFADADFSADNVAKLRSAMKAALTKAGLFDDEATAMLETWKLSYFKSNGQRLFFIVPQEWTDSVLPLKFSQKCDVTRVMMGRIELVTPTQRVALERLTDRTHPPTAEERKELLPLLGRFADALLENQRQRAQLQASAE